MLKEAQDINIYTYTDVSKYLADLYRLLKASRKRYSYDQYAADLGFNRSSFLYQVIHGDRKLTTAAGKKIAEAIPLRKAARHYFLAMIKHSYTKDPRERHEAFEQILHIRATTLNSEVDRHMLQYFSEWYHPVVRELVSLADFQPDPKWIAKQLCPEIKPEQAVTSFELLQKIGFIRFDVATARWVQTEAVVASDHDVRRLGLIAYHQDMLQRAKESIMNIRSREREIEALTFSTSEEEFEQLKAAIQNFTKQIVKNYKESDQHDRVVQLNLQLFPVALPKSKRVVK